MAAMPLPLTIAQRNVWTAQKLAPADPLYNIGGFVELPASVSRDRLETVVLRALREADSLLFIFIDTERGPSQVRTEVTDVEIPFVHLDCSTSPRASAVAWMESDLQRPFDLGTGPLFRFALIRISDECALWYCAFHHLVTDLFGTVTFLRRAAELYDAAIGELRPPPTDLTPWSEVVGDEEEYRSSPLFHRDRRYWNELLRTRPEAVTLSGRQPGWSNATVAAVGTIAGSTVSRLEELAARRRTSLVAVLYSAVALYLSRVTGCCDLVVGMPVAARTNSKLRRSTGFVANVLPLRLNVDLAGTFADLVQQTGTRIREALGRQRYSSGQLRADLALAANEPNIYGVVLNFLPSDTHFEFAGHQVELNIFTNANQVEDLRITCHARGSGSDLVLQFDANHDSYDAASLQQHLRNFLGLLETVAAGCEMPARRIPLLDDEARRIFDERRGKSCAVAQKTLVELFEAQVEAAPEAIALVKGKRSISYRELNARANQLARRLIDRGVGAECVVGLWADRSVEMLIGLIGILKAGGAYLPLDPAYPESRLRLMAQDAQPMLLVRSSASPAADELIGGIPQLTVDSGEPLSNPAPATFGKRSEAAHAAFIIYTSGSTGIPKGVVVTQAGLSALALAQRQSLQVTRTSRVLQFASLNFDASLWETLMALSNGAVLVLAPVEALSAEGLQTLLVGEGITHATLPPAVLATLRRCKDLALECLVVAGESCPAALIAEWCRGLRMINAYGPTETTVCATMSAPLTCEDVAAHGSAPIGMPIEGTCIYVLDAGLEPVPAGAAGELYISGVALARGYLNRPGLTAERFVADPYGEPGSRMYRSGDLVRWRKDGALEYLGRADQQVKVRGHRIELGEIESVLRAVPEIGQAAVDVYEDETAGKNLVAYLVSQSGQPIDATKLRRVLADLLPQYMVPVRFIPLASLPLTPNGKLDRRALPALAKDVPLDTLVEPPRTPTEVRLAAIFREILRTTSVGRSADFFALGGHSLSGLQVIARVRDVFGPDLSLKTLFDASTVESLAGEIDKALSAGATRRLASIESAEEEGPAPLSYSQERMWLIQSLNPANTAYNMGASLWINGSLDVEALSHSYDELFRRHDILRTRVRLIDDRPQQIVDPWRAGTLTIVDLRSHHDAKDEALRRVDTDLRGVFDLSNEPVIRSQLFRTANDLFLLSIVLHHIAGDQWSMGVFGRELATLYNHRRRGESVPLEPLPVSYRDYARWQRSDAFTAEFDQQLEFWKRQLADLPTVDLPVDFTRPKVWTMSGASYVQPIPSDLFGAIGTLARSTGSTVFMTLFSAFVTLLHRISGQKDIPVGVPVANRPRSNIEGLIGTFVNTVIMRADLTHDPAFRDLLVRVRTTALAAFANQDISFDRLVQEIGQRGDRSRAPLAQVMFNVPNAPMHQIVLDELNWEHVILDRRGAQFELAFTFDTEVTRNVIVEYNTDLFERATIERLVGQYFTLLEAAAANPHWPVSRLSILPPEQWACLRRWNATDVSLQAAATFPRLFEAQVAHSADDVAISFEGGSLTYGELNARANDLARLLKAAGARRGERVAVCMRRSPSLIMSLLAVQKSGAAYLPLDPDFPPERLMYMLSDSGVRALVTSGPAPEGLELPAGIAVLDVAEMPPGRGGQSASDLVDGPGPHDAAYVLYTSGSTGRPKGVIVPHGALANFLASMRERPGLTSADVLAAVTTVSFDISALELYLPLMVGARIELISRQVATDGTALAELLDTGRITMLQATPATWRMLLEAGWRGGIGLRALCGGEALSRKLADDILERVGELWNMYGPTETTIWSTLDRVERGISAVSIGRPISNTKVHILDATGAIVPIGAVGEICIGGSGVAIGYHARPALTAERFIADAYSESPGARLYKTGDLGRWGSDGKLYHLGRSDHQVKIRGFRIELGEIEEALTAHSAIQHAVTAVREARADDARLVAYVAYRDGEDVTIGDLKRFLRTRLPDYMVPSIVVPMVTMPLTPNGKVDRGALPDPFSTMLREEPTENLPDSAMEQVLADIWGSVLKIEKINASDNFFALGGYSLLSLRVAKLIEKRTGQRLDPRSLFFLTLREVAGILESEELPAEAMER